MLACVKGTLDFVSAGREKNFWERENWVVISWGVMGWLVRTKKPSVSAALMSWVVISSMRVGKSWREILGMVRLVYFVSAMAVIFSDSWTLVLRLFGLMGVLRLEI